MTELEKYLDHIKGIGGIYDYEIIGTTPDGIVDVLIKPSPPIPKIDLNRIFKTVLFVETVEELFKEFPLRLGQKAFVRENATVYISVPDELADPTHGSFFVWEKYT